MVTASRRNTKAAVAASYNRKGSNWRQLLEEEEGRTSKPTTRVLTAHTPATARK